MCEDSRHTQPEAGSYFYVRLSARLYGRFEMIEVIKVTAQECRNGRSNNMKYEMKNAAPIDMILCLEDVHTLSIYLSLSLSLSLFHDETAGNCLRAPLTRASLTFPDHMVHTKASKRKSASIKSMMLCAAELSRARLHSIP